MFCARLILSGEESQSAGFCLRIQKGRKKVYVVCRKVKGSQRNTTVTVGDHGVISTEQARTHAKHLIALMAQGINPNEKRKEERKHEEDKRQAEKSREMEKSISLRSALDDYLRVRDLKQNTKYIYRVCIEHYLADWLDLPLVEITSDLIEKKHLQLSEYKAQVNNTMRVLRAIFTYACVAYAKPDGKPLLSENHVGRLSQTRLWNRIPRRQTVVKTHQLANWYAAVAGLQNDVVRDYLLLVLFTGLRKTEAASLSWKCVDMQGRTLVVADTKNRQDHMLPLSDFLYNVLLRRWQTRVNDFVFPGESGKSYIKDCANHIKAVCNESGLLFTLHDLRRTFITTAEQLDIPYYALKRLANHKTNADVTSGYIISDAERLREPMQKITNELSARYGIRAKDMQNSTATKKRDQKARSNSMR
jgi:integrase